MKEVVHRRNRLVLAVVLAIAEADLAGFAACGAESNVAGWPAANGTHSLTLGAAIRLALQTNPSLRSARGRRDASEGRAAQAGVWTNPELELIADDWPVSHGRGWSDAKQTIGVAQTLPFPGKKPLDQQIGLSGVALSEAELGLRRAELVRDVKAEFARVLGAERLVEVAQELVQVAELSVATARKRVDAGAIAYQEQLRAEIQLEQAKTELIGFQRELATGRQALLTLLGRPDLLETPLSGTLAESPNAGLLDHQSPHWLTAHPSIAAAQASLDRAQLEQRRVRLEPYPDVRVAVGGGRMGGTDESMLQLGFSLPLPILDRSKGRKREAQANIIVAESEMMAVEQQLRREWANAMKRYRAAAAQVANCRDRILPRATEALRLVQLGFEEGKFNFIDLLDTQRTTAEARLAYQQKLIEMSVAQAELEALVHPQNLETPSPQGD